MLYWRRQSGGQWTLPIGLGDRWALGMRCVLVAVLALTLLRPTLPRWVDRQNVVFLLDVSDSVSLAARERAYRFVDAAEMEDALRDGLRGISHGGPDTEATHMLPDTEATRMLSGTRITTPPPVPHQSHTGHAVRPRSPLQPAPAGRPRVNGSRRAPGSC